MPLAFVITAVVVATAVLWIVWRLRSRKTLLPCPAEFAWLVEVENPLARATRSEQVVDALAPQPGDTVADIGCGPGRVTIPLARAVGSHGEVIALDVQAAMLARVGDKAAREELRNVRLVYADARDEQIPPGTLDGAVMVMALGEIPEDAAILSFVHAALKPGGRLVVAESVFDPHYVRRDKLRRKAHAAGFAEEQCAGNLFGYSLRLRKPAS